MKDKYFILPARIFKIMNSSNLKYSKNWVPLSYTECLNNKNIHANNKILVDYLNC